MPPNSSPKRTPTLAVAFRPRREVRAWLEPMRGALPELRVERIEDLAPAEIDYAAVWGKAAELGHCPNLKAIVSLGAGVDHILSDPALAHLSVVRMIDPGLTRGMTEFAVLQTLHHHRRMPAYQALQRDRRWEPFYTPLAAERRVGVMGMGVLGRDAAKALKALGFKVAGWSRSAKRLKGIQSFAGAAQLDRFLARAEILICLLPLTPDTRHILNAGLFARLPAGAAVINLARGGHLVEADLVAALDSGHLSGASLDVFEREPLPRTSPLWTHPKVTVTPHIASLTQRDSGARFVARAVRSLIAGKKPPGLVDRRRGY